MTTHPTRRRRFVVRFNSTVGDYEVYDRNRRTSVCALLTRRLATNRAEYLNRTHSHAN